MWILPRTAVGRPQLLGRPPVGLVAVAAAQAEAQPIGRCMGQAVGVCRPEDWC